MHRTLRLIALLSLLVSVACSGESVESGASAEPTPVAVQDGPASDTVLAYIKVQQALAADDFEQAKAALGGLMERSQGDIRDIAGQALAAQEIASMRDAFVELSTKMLADSPQLGNHKIAFCPMANEGEGARWIQQTGEIRNPYYGADMLTCGAFEN